MNSFNANVAGYLSDAYVQWTALLDGGWQGSFEYNTGWIKRDDIDKVLKPGRYTLIEESSEYEIDIERVVPEGGDIYRVHFRGVGEMPLERTWNRARDLSSSLSWDEQVMQKIESGHKTSGDLWVESLEKKNDGCTGCFIAVVVAVGVLWAVDYFFDIF